MKLFSVRPPVGGWLLVLCALLVLWQPLSLSLVVSNTLEAISMRGRPAFLVLALRLFVSAFGIAAGLALLRLRPAAVTMAKVSLVASAATDVFVIATPYAPNNRVPGDEPLYIAASLAYCGVWLAYLSRSKRVRRTFAP